MNIWASLKFIQLGFEQAAAYFKLDTTISAANYGCKIRTPKGTQGGSDLSLSLPVRPLLQSVEDAIMTKTPWIVGAAMASVLAVTGLAHAMPGDHDGRMGPPKTRAELQAKITEHFKQADANKDGAVTKAEADAAREAMKSKFAEHRAERRSEHFAKLDADKNGQLSKEEFSAPRERGDHKDGDRAGGGDGHGGKHWGHRGMRGHHGAMAMGMRGPWFERADANKDGKVTLAEASAGPLEMFDKADANKDGTISPEEHQAARAHMRAKWQEMRGQPKG